MVVGCGRPAFGKVVKGWPFCLSCDMRVTSACDGERRGGQFACRGKRCMKSRKSVHHIRDSRACQLQFSDDERSGAGESGKVEQGCRKTS